MPLKTHVWLGSEQGFAQDRSAWLLSQYMSGPAPPKQLPKDAEHAGMVLQHGSPGCPHASHSDLPPMATQTLPAWHDVPQHGPPETPHPDEEPDADPDDEEAEPDAEMEPDAEPEPVVESEPVEESKLVMKPELEEDPDPLPDPEPLADPVDDAPPSPGATMVTEPPQPAAAVAPWARTTTMLASPCLIITPF